MDIVHLISDVSIVEVLATDVDGVTLTYTIQNGDDTIEKFKLDAVQLNRIVTTAEAIDYETKSSYTLLVTADDTAHTSTATIIVTVKLTVTNTK
mgnify:FL=1